MRVHEFGFVVVIAALFAEVKILCCTIDGWGSVFAVATTKITNFKLLILRYCEIRLVLHLVLPVLLDEKVILEGILVFGLDYQRVTVLHFWGLSRARCAQADFAEQKGEYFIGLVGVAMDVDVAGVEDQVLQCNFFGEDLAVVIFAEVS